GEPALPALRRLARGHPDVEVRLRAMVVARAIRSRGWGLIKAMGPGATLTASPFGGGYWLNRVAFSGDGKYPVVGGRALILFALAPGREGGRVLEVGGARPGLAMSADGKRCLTAHANSTVFHLVEVPSLRTVQTFTGHVRGLVCVELSPDGALAASASV